MKDLKAININQEDSGVAFEACPLDAIVKCRQN
jgi:hypothetical protein